MKHLSAGLLLVALAACSGGDGTDDTGEPATCPDPTTTVYDGDGDGSPNGVDCDDGDPEQAPHLQEVCGDGKDNDCDDEVDDFGVGADVPWYADEDDDGWGDGAALLLVCEGHDPGDGWVAQSGDCAPANENVHPGALDTTCDLIDDNCDGSVDEAADWRYWYPDGDNDGYGVWTDWPIYSCDSTAMGMMQLADNPDDCDDTESGIHPNIYDPPGGGDWDCDGYDD